MVPIAREESETVLTPIGVPQEEYQDMQLPHICKGPRGLGQSHTGSLVVTSDSVGSDEHRIFDSCDILDLSGSYCPSFPLQQDSTIFT